MNNTFLLIGSIGILVIIGIALVKISNARSKTVHRQILERYLQSRQALVLYVMLHRQCSEERAYQRIAAFVKRYFPSEEPRAIDWAMTNDRQSLLDRAYSILILDPDEIDKI